MDWNWWKLMGYWMKISYRLMQKQLRYPDLIFKINDKQSEAVNTKQRDDSALQSVLRGCIRSTNIQGTTNNHNCSLFGHFYPLLYPSMHRCKMLRNQESLQWWFLVPTSYYALVAIPQTATFCLLHSAFAERCGKNIYHGCSKEWIAQHFGSITDSVSKSEWSLYLIYVIYRHDRF